MVRGRGCVTEAELIQFVTSLPGVTAMTPGPGSDAPEIAWGDTFIFYDPQGAPSDRRMPFATIVTKDYPEFDTASNLDRPGIFRLNIAVGRTRFEDLLGYPPAAHPQHHTDIDYTALDQVLPHPVYATQGWISILNPGERTSDVARSLLREAHTRAANRPRPAQ